MENQRTYGDIEGELKSMNNFWGTIEKMAKDRQKWRTFVAALHANDQVITFVSFQDLVPMLIDLKDDPDVFHLGVK